MFDEYSTSSRKWLSHFPVTSRTRVGLWFNLTAGRARERLTPAQLITRIRLDMLRRKEDDAKLVLRALEDDPEGAMAYAQSVIDYQALSAAEQAQVRAARGEEFKRAAIARKPPSAPQLALLRSLHYAGPRPANSQEASTLIDALRRR
jgi:hypothetical protein